MPQGFHTVISLIKGENTMTNIGRITQLDSVPSFRDLNRFTVGFDKMFDSLNYHMVNSKSDVSYPPYNIIKHSDTHYSIEIAVAGFDISDIEVQTHETELFIRGSRKQEDAREFLHRGIGLRNFERRFTLANQVEVRAAEVVNGLLSIELELVIPESQRPRQIPVTFRK